MSSFSAGTSPESDLELASNNPSLFAVFLTLHYQVPHQLPQVYTKHQLDAKVRHKRFLVKFLFYICPSSTYRYDELQKQSSNIPESTMSSLMLPQSFQLFSLLPMLLHQAHHLSPQITHLFQTQHSNIHRL